MPTLPVTTRRHADAGLIQITVDALIEELARLRLTVSFETDFSKLVEFLTQNGAKLINQSFNPVHSDIAPESFWMRVYDENGITIGSHAQGIYRDADLVELIQSGRLWYRGGYVHKDGEIPPRMKPLSQPVTGTLAHAGALWINPAWRKRGLSVFLPFLSRAVCLRNTNVDYFTALVFDSLAKHGLARTGYGYTHVEPFFDGWLPPGQCNASMYAAYMSDQETIAQMRELPRHARFPVMMPTARDTAAD